MKKLLTKTTKELYFYKDGIKNIVDYKDKTTYPKEISGNISGLFGEISNKLSGNITGLSGEISSGLSGEISNGLSGNITGLSGEISSGLYGNISGLYGEISNGLSGNITGFCGSCTSIVGNIDDCELTEEEREAGINIEDLIG